MIPSHNECPDKNGVRCTRSFKLNLNIRVLLKLNGVLISLKASRIRSSKFVCEVEGRFIFKGDGNAIQVNTTFRSNGYTVFS